MAISNLTTGLRPGVCTSTTRPTAPYEGQMIYETDTKQTLVYNGSTWVMLTDADTPPGLVLVKTQTIGTTVASVEVTDAFNSDFENYKIIISGGVASTAVDLAFTLGSSATGYYGGVMYHPYSTAGPSGVNAVGLNNATRFLYAGTGSASALNSNIDVYSPNVAKVTAITVQYAVMNTSGSVVNANGFHNVATAYTAFTITAVTGTMTGGTIRVYGYRNTI